MLETLIAVNAKKVANLPKAVRAGLAGLLVYTSAVGVVNLAPEKMNYVPVLSNVTPVLAQVTQAGVTRTELISHTEFTRINETGAQLAQNLEELNNEIETVVEQFDNEIDALVGSLNQESGEGVWVEDDFRDEYRYTVESYVTDEGVIINEITYSDGLKGLLILDSDNTGFYSTLPEAGEGEGVVSIVRWFAHRNGTIVITDDKFEASFTEGLTIN